MITISLEVIYLLLGSLLYSILSVLIICTIVACFFISGIFGNNAFNYNTVYLSILGVVITILNLYITFNGFVKIFME